MKRYCELCEKHCPIDDLGCGDGRRTYAAEMLLDEMDGAEPEERRIPEGEMPRGPRIPRENDEVEGHRTPVHAFDKREGHRPPHAFDVSDGAHRPLHGPHGGLHDPHHPPFPPYDGFGPRGPHPRPPRFDPEELLRQAEGASTLELFDMCHRALHRPDAGAMRGQGRALAILAARGEMSQRELQDALRVAPGSMSELIAKLERKGLLSRERGDDKRSNRLRITDAGREAAAQVASPGDELFSALSDDQREQFAATLKLLLADWLRRGERGTSERPE